MDNNARSHLTKGNSISKRKVSSDEDGDDLKDDIEDKNASFSDYSIAKTT